MSQIISSETVKRLLRDVRQMLHEPLHDNGIYYLHDNDDMMKGLAMIVGTENTPYFGGYYLFKFEYPLDYPYSPPTVKFMTNDGSTRFHPNLYINGNVCISILNTWEGEKWSSCQSIKSVLLTLASLLNEKPLLNEPDFSDTDEDFVPYQKTIEFVNIKYSICKQINIMLSNKWPTDLQSFRETVIELFYKNYNKLLEIVNSKIHLYPVLETVKCYQMVTCISYKTLNKELEFTKKMVDEIMNKNKIEL